MDFRVEIISKLNSVTEEQVEFKILVNGEEITKNILNFYLVGREAEDFFGPASINKTYVLNKHLDSQSREILMRVLEFTEIIEDGMGEHPVDFLINGTKDLNETFRTDGWEFEYSWE